MSSKEAPDRLWDLLDSSDEEVSFLAFEEIVIHYQYLVEAIARKLKGRLPTYLEFDELLSLGQLGLLKAIGKYEVHVGPFSRYASAVVWGAIIDGLRSDDFAPRGLRKRQRELEAAIKSLQEAGQTDPTTEEIADHMDLTSGDVRDLQHQIARAEITPTDPTLMPSYRQSNAVGDSWSREMCWEFVEWLQEHDPLTQEIIILKYWKGVSLKAISEFLDEPMSVVQQKHQNVLSTILPFMRELAEA